MTSLIRIATAASLMSATVFAVSIMPSAAEQLAKPDPTKPTSMSPGKAVELQIGDQHAISYFQPSPDGCSLTVVLADGQPGEGGQEAHGTRMVVPIAPGKTARIDGTQRKSADFVCGEKGEKMDARVYERQSYKADKSMSKS